MEMLEPDSRAFDRMVLSLPPFGRRRSRVWRVVYRLRGWWRS